MLNKKQLKDKDYSGGFTVREIGRVKSVREFIVIATDLPSSINGQIVRFEKGQRGLVIGFSKDEVQILYFGPKDSIHAGDPIFNKGEKLSLPVGDKFLGRVVNALCEPQDKQEPIEESSRYPVFGVAPGVMERKPVRKTLETGTTILDAAVPIAKGQRQLIIGDRLTGKTTVTVDAILNQKNKDVICIYCCIGKPYQTLLKVLNALYAKNAMDYTIVVSGVASTSAAEQYLAPYTACMLGEYFMQNGRDSLVIFDDLSKHAWIYRQISLLLGRAPGREAYPGDIFYIHSQLMERAGYLNSELGEGSMTFLPIIEILQGDVTGYISTNLISMTDGQIYFDTSLFNMGVKPAIDLGLSVSRIGSKAQWPAMEEVSKSLRLEYLQYLKLLEMTRLRSAGLSESAKKRLHRGEIIGKILIQDKNEPTSMENQILCLYALNKNILDNISLQEVDRFKEKIIETIERLQPDLLKKLRDSQSLTEGMKNKFDDCIKEYFKNNQEDKKE